MRFPFVNAIGTSDFVARCHALPGNAGFEINLGNAALPSCMDRYQYGFFNKVKKQGGFLIKKKFKIV